MQRSAIAYQTAPVGARSKLLTPCIRSMFFLTRRPRWGPDQNQRHQIRLSIEGLPDGPGGGQIKTASPVVAAVLRPYQTAPVGARSKQITPLVMAARKLTRRPRWGPDQNCFLVSASCPLILPDGPGGGQIKTSGAIHSRGHRAYQTAPVGARSKPELGHLHVERSLTRRPRWGPDQNRSPDGFKGRNVLPDGPGGGQIKT